MYSLFNVLAWIWIVAVGIILVVGVFTVLRRTFVTSYPRSLSLRMATFGQLYGNTWIIPTVAIVAALTVDFDPTLQWWVVVTAASFIALRFINVLAVKVANS